MVNASTDTLSRNRSGRTFYLGMAFTVVGIAILGFVPTFFMPLAGGTFDLPPIVLVHAAIFFAWTLFLCTQAWFVYTGHTPSHREWGMVGISLATAMVFTVVMASGVMVRLRTAAGNGDAALAFMWLQIGGLLFFACAFGSAIANIRNPEAHKRLILIATIALLEAPIARWVLAIAGQIPAAGAPPAVAHVLPASILADLLIVVAMFVDWRTLGRPHRVYLMWFPALLIFQFTRTYISETPVWHSIALWITSLTGS